MSIEDQRRRLHGGPGRDHNEELLIKGLLEELEEVRAENKRLTRIIERLSSPPQKVRQIIYLIINSKKVIMDPLQLNPGTQAPILPALVDAVTLQPIPGATFVPKSNTVDNPAVASVDANNNLVYVGAGTGNLTSTNTWTYTDQNTKQQVTVDQTTVSPIQMNAAAEAVAQQIGLGTPVPIPAAQ